MSLSVPAITQSVQARARLSQGTSGSAIHAMVAAALRGRHPGRGTLLDVGCGRGRLWSTLQPLFDCYVGADVVRYDGFPEEGQFVSVDLDGQGLPIEDEFADVVVAVETIEHLENPRSFFRELVRLTRPGGLVVVTTPNQLSLLSKLTLVLKNQFNAFQDSSYPAHLTALLEIDLLRLAQESSLADIGVRYSREGRIPGTPWHYPRLLSSLLPRALSDNVLVMGRKVDPCG